MRTTGLWMLLVIPFWPQAACARDTTDPQAAGAARPVHAVVGTWAAEEHLAIVPEDRKIRDDDIARSNLILWCNPASDRVLARIEKLPVKWTAEPVSTPPARRFRGNVVQAGFYSVE
jgi:hypothetical protein